MCEIMEFTDILKFIKLDNSLFLLRLFKLFLSQLTSGNLNCYTFFFSARTLVQIVITIILEPI